MNEGMIIITFSSVYVLVLGSQVCNASPMAQENLKMVGPILHHVCRT
jgi:hypothetical protein